MNRSTNHLRTAAAVIVLMATASAAISQWPAAPTGPKSALELLTAAKATNAALLLKQQQTLEKLDAIQKEADQLRIYVKRS